MTPLLLEAHADTLGGMVAEIKGDGRLRIVNVGGMNANNAEAENCRVVTKFSGSYEGTLQLINASIHVNGDYASTKRSWDTVEVVLDEAVESADDVKALGISVGDFVCFEPRTRVTKSGYIRAASSTTSCPSASCSALPNICTMRAKRPPAASTPM